MKNLHLVPPNVIDLVDKINDERVKGNERNNYILRLETTSEFITEALTKQKSPFVERQDRSKMNYSRIGRNNV
jgi:hypothetical protein